MPVKQAPEIRNAIRATKQFEGITPASFLRILKMSNSSTGSQKDHFKKKADHNSV